MTTIDFSRKLPFSARFHVSQNTLSKTYPNGQIALVHLKTRRIQILNSTASDVWKLLIAGNSREEILERCSQAFDADVKEISKDIDAILKLLEAEGLISIEE